MDGVHKKGTYTGEYNQRGERHGAGVMTYEGGSLNPGPWVNGGIHPDEPARVLRLLKAQRELDIVYELLQGPVLALAGGDGSALPSAEKTALVASVAELEAKLTAYIANGARDPATAEGMESARVLCAQAEALAVTGSFAAFLPCVYVSVGGLFVTACCLHCRPSSLFILIDNVAAAVPSNDG